MRVTVPQWAGRGVRNRSKGLSIRGLCQIANGVPNERRCLESVGNAARMLSARRAGVSQSRADVRDALLAGRPCCARVSSGRFLSARP